MRVLNTICFHIDQPERYKYKKISITIRNNLRGIQFSRAIKLALYDDDDDDYDDDYGDDNDDYGDNDDDGDGDDYDDDDYYD
jgi:hypothetical protein